MLPPLNLGTAGKNYLTKPDKFHVYPVDGASSSSRRKGSQRVAAESIAVKCKRVSRPGDTDASQVWNLDEQGVELSPGKMEVNATDLVLHQRGRPPVRWPLRGLRRYGFDAQLFSFESGRRCPTGSGIYAFRCNRAEGLFNALQASRAAVQIGPLNRARGKETFELLRNAGRVPLPRSIGTVVVR